MTKNKIKNTIQSRFRKYFNNVKVTEVEIKKDILHNKKCGKKGVSMKKIVSVIAAAAFLAAGVAFAQEAADETTATEETVVEESSEEEATEEEAAEEEAEPEAKPEWKVSGVYANGIQYGIESKTYDLTENDYGANRFRFNFNYTYGNVGIKGRVQVADYDIASLSTTYLYGWASLFDGALDVKFGKLYNTAIAPCFTAAGLYGNGLNVVYNVGDFSFGGTYYVADRSATTLTDLTFDATRLYGGAAYNGESFSVVAGFGYDPYFKAGMSAEFLAQYYGKEEIYAWAEYDLTGINEIVDGTSTVVNIQVACVGVDLSFEKLPMFEFVLTTYGGWNYIEGNVSYDIASTGLTVEMPCGVTFVCYDYNGFYVRPGVVYTLGKKTTVGLHYEYIADAQGAASFFETSRGVAGNNIELDFMFGF